jgi:hypothetical protein
MRRMAMICAPVVIALVITGVAFAATYRGRTSQGKKVEVGMAARHELKSLILVFSTRCSNNQKREFSTGFVRPFRIPQNAAGVVGDTIHVLSDGRNASHYRDGSPQGDAAPIGLDLSKRAGPFPGRYLTDSRTPLSTVRLLHIDVAVG